MCHGIEVTRVTICESIPEKSFCPLVGTQWRPWWNLGLYCLPKYTIRSYRYTRVEGWNPKWKFRTQRRPITMWYVWPANAQTCLRIGAVWSETLLALIFYECLSYWPNIIWSRKLKRWLHRLVAFTPHWWRQSYDTATARVRVNISCCKKENEKKKKKKKKNMQQTK